MADKNGDTRRRPNRRRLVAGTALLAALLAVNGLVRMDSSASTVLPTGAVRGTVTYRGQTLNGGQVRFTSRDPANKVGHASGAIDRQGRYTFAGAPLGPVTVTVDTSIRPAEDRFWRPGSKSPKPVYIPARFADPKQSGVTLELKEGVQDCDIRLE